MRRVAVLGALAFMSSIAIPAPGRADEAGIASSYPVSYKGRRTASGEKFDPSAMTCAHRRYPFGTILTVSTTSHSVTCRVTDRGPFVHGRIVDLSPAASKALGVSGLARVTVVTSSQH